MANSLNMVNLLNAPPAPALLEVERNEKAWCTDAEVKGYAIDYCESGFLDSSENPFIQALLIPNIYKPGWAIGMLANSRMPLYYMWYNPATARNGNGNLAFSSFFKSKITTQTEYLSWEKKAYFDLENVVAISRTEYELGEDKGDEKLTHTFTRAYPFSLQHIIEAPPLEATYGIKGAFKAPLRAVCGLVIGGGFAEPGKQLRILCEDNKGNLIKWITVYSFAEEIIKTSISQDIYGFWHDPRELSFILDKLKQSLFSQVTQEL